MALFQFGFGGAYQLLHTRRIGLHDGNEVPIIEGLKLSARPSESLQMSLLHVTSLKTDDLPNTSHGVFRAQYELGGGSNIGVMVTHRQSMTELSDHNLVVGLDGAWRGSGTPMLVESFAALSIDSYSEAASESTMGALVGAKAKWRGELIRPELTYLYVHPDFQADLGFIRRRAIQSLQAQFLVEPRPKAMGFEKMQLFVNGDVIGNESFDTLLDWSTGTGIRLYGASGFSGKLELSFGSELVDDTFDVGPKTIEAGRYDSLRLHLSMRTPSNARIRVSPFFQIGDYYGGSITTAGMEVDVRPMAALRFDGEFRFDRAAFDDGGDFDSIVVNGSVNADFMTDLGLKVQVGWSHLDARIQLQSRLRWTYLPGSDLFLVYQADLNSDTDSLAFQSLQLKLTFRYPWG